MSALQKTLDSHVERGTVPGVVAALGYADGRLEVASAGDLAVDSVVRVQSMTKAVVTVATLRLVERGRLDLDDPVQRWLPELCDRHVLRSPGADLSDVAPAQRPITVRHLLTNTSGYGMALEPSPLQDAMRRTRTEAGAGPVELAADAWVAALAELPLAFEPGSGWRYHHGFGLLGVLLSRLVASPLDEYLAADLFAPLGMLDTGFVVPASEAHRLPAAYRRREDRTFQQLEPAGEGFYVAPAPFDVSHAELVSTVTDYAAFARMLAAGGAHEGQQIVHPSLLRQMVGDQVLAAAKTPESFFPGFWEGTGWGYGVAVQTSGPHRGRYGWSGGLGTDFFVDPDGSFGIVMAQVEMDAEIFGLLGDVMGLLD
ncbi:MAG: serine hydrolase domain-containing protein [Ornithinimicrobium sp.]